MRSSATSLQITSKHPQRVRVLLIIGVVLLAANLRTAITSVGPVIDAIRASTGLSNTEAGLLTTIPLIAFAILSPLVPRIARRLGAEMTLFSSLIVLCIGIALRYIPSLSALFTGTIALGLAIAVGNVLLPSIVKRDFPTQVGLVTGLYSMSMNIWAALASGLSIPIAVNLHLGWRGALGCWVILALIAVLVWLFLLPRTGKQTPEVQQKSIVRQVKGVWKSPLAWQVTLFMGLQSLGFYITVAWLPVMLHSRGMSVSTAGWMVSLMQFVSFPATFIVPILAGKRANQKSIVTIITIVFLIGYIGLEIPGTMLTPLWIVFVGLGQGASISLALAFFSLRTQNAAEAAELSGMAQSIGYLLAAVGPILFGFLHDLTHRWTIPLTILVIATVLQFIFGLGAGRNARVATTLSE